MSRIARFALMMLFLSLSTQSAQAKPVTPHVPYAPAYSGGLVYEKLVALDHVLDKQSITGHAWMDAPANAQVTELIEFDAGRPQHWTPFNCGVTPTSRAIRHGSRITHSLRVVMPLACMQAQRDAVHGGQHVSVLVTYKVKMLGQRNFRTIRIRTDITFNLTPQGEAS